MVFECNLRQFDGNPLHVDTPFGRPVLVAVGNVTEDRDWLEAQLFDLNHEMPAPPASADQE